MSEQILKQILEELKAVREEQLVMKEELQASRKEQLVMKEELQASRKEQLVIKEELQASRKEQLSMKDNQLLMQKQLAETNQIVHSIYDRQEETDAKLESLSLDVHKLHGEVVSTKETVVDMIDEIEFTYQKTAKNELEIFKLRKEQAE